MCLMGMSAYAMYEVMFDDGIADAWLYLLHTIRLQLIADANAASWTDAITVKVQSEQTHHHKQ